MNVAEQSRQAPDKAPAIFYDRVTVCDFEDAQGAEQGDRPWTSLVASSADTHRQALMLDRLPHAYSHNASCQAYNHYLPAIRERGQAHSKKTGE